MGEIKVTGNAERTVSCDVMKIRLSFYAKEKTTAEASERVMQECESFLAVLKKRGWDISRITLAEDEVREASPYGYDDVMPGQYQADRKLQIKTAYDAGRINELRSIANKMNYTVRFAVEYEVSNENAIRKELMEDALKNAKEEAETLAGAIGQRIAGLISAQKNRDYYSADDIDDVMCLAEDVDEEDEDGFEIYDHSNALASTEATLSEVIYTTWEIA